MNLCDYGCGKEAKFLFKNGKYCCSKNISFCESIKNKIGSKNSNNHWGETAKNKRNETIDNYELNHDSTKLCSYNCGNIAKYIFKNGKFCCEKRPSMCSMVIKIKKYKTPWNKGIKTNIIPWSKGLTKYTDERVRSISEKNTGKKLTQEHKTKLKKIKLKLFKDKTKHPSYKGEYYSKNIPLYDTYASKLTIEEEPKRDDLDKNILTVICTYCKKRFIPKATDVVERINSLNGDYGERRLYCSKECKNECPIFKRRIYQSNHPKNKNVYYNSSEYNIFRNFVLKRDNNICQYCGEKAEHVHHTKPQKLEPFFSLDPDYAISVCKTCHYKYGHQDECSTTNIGNKICLDLIKTGDM